LKLYRAFPLDPDATERDPGGALYVPRGGAGRIDNPELYSVLYLSSHEAGAVAENFGRFPIWDDEMFFHANGNRFALSAYDVPDSLHFYDMNVAANLTALGISPANVVKRERRLTQSWAKRVFAGGAYAGISWWSYYLPTWFSYGLWDHGTVEALGTPTPLTSRHPAVIEAAQEIMRIVRT